MDVRGAWRGVQRVHGRAAHPTTTTIIACPRLSRITEGVKLSDWLRSGVGSCPRRTPL